MAKKYDLDNDDLYNFDSDDYGDDKLDSLLDEIAEIKKTIQGLPSEEGDFPSDYDAGYEDAMPRDDTALASTTRKLQNDILRLTDTLDDMRDDGRAGHNEEIDGALGKLVALGEELIRSGKAADRKFDSEIAALKKQISRVGSGDITPSITAIQSEMKSSGEMLAGINTTVEELASRTAASPQKSAPYAEIIRQLYDLKRLLGSPSVIGEKRNDEILELYNLLAKARSDIRRGGSIADKFASMDELVAKLKATAEYDVEPVVEGANELIDELMDLPLTGDDADALIAYAGTGEMPAVSAAKRKTVMEYLETAEGIVRDGNVGNMDDLPDIIALKNSIQGSRNEFALESVYSSVLNTNISMMSEKDAIRQKELRAELREKLNSLTALQVRDLVEYPKVKAEKAFRMSRHSGGDGLFDKINELKNYLLDNAAARPAAPGAAPEIEEAESAEEKTEHVSFIGADSISNALLDIKTECLNILERLDERNAEDSGIVQGAPTLDEIVAQLDRLFDDVKNLLSDAENNIMSSLMVMGEAVAHIAENGDSAAADRRKLLDDAAVIRALTEDNSRRDESPAEEETDETIASESGKATVEERLAAIESGQAAIMEAIGKLSGGESIDALGGEIKSLSARLDALETSFNPTAIKSEIKLLRDQLFAVSMASVGEGGEDKFESYNHVILGEIYSVADAVEENAEKTEKELKAIKEQLSSLKSRAAMGKAPAAKKPTAPAAKKPAPRKKVAPVAMGDASINELLSEMRKTDVIIEE